MNVERERMELSRWRTRPMSTAMSACACKQSIVDSGMGLMSMNAFPLGNDCLDCVVAVQWDHSLTGVICVIFSSSRSSSASLREERTGEVHLHSFLVPKSTEFYLTQQSSSRETGRNRTPSRERENDLSRRRMVVLTAGE